MRAKAINSLTERAGSEGCTSNTNGDSAASERHRKLHERYRPDDNARDRAVATARRNNPAADHATQAIVLYDLQHPQSLSIGASPSRAVSTSSPIPAPLPAKTTAAR